MDRKFKISILLSLVILILPPFVRFVLQVELIPDSIYHIEGLNRKFQILWSGEGFLINGKKTLKPEACFSSGNNCFCLKTTPTSYRTVFKRAISALGQNSWMIGSRGSNLIVKLSRELHKKTGCKGPVVTFRKEGKALLFSSCLRALLIEGCTKKTILPGKTEILKEGEYILIPPIKMRILFRKTLKLLPGKKGEMIRLFPEERRILEIQQLHDIEPIYASIRDKEGVIYPLKKGENVFKPSKRILPLFPLKSYRNQREIFIEKLIKEKNYRVEGGFYRPVPSGNAYRVAKALGYWKIFKRELTILNSTLGKNGIYSRMPCFKMKIVLKSGESTLNGNSLSWLYSPTPYNSPLGWHPALKYGDWVCGEFWSPYFRGTRRRYFRTTLNLPFIPKTADIIIPSNGFLFINGKPAGNNKEFLQSIHAGKNTLSLLLEIPGLEKGGSPFKIKKDLDLLFSRKDIRRSLTPQAKGGVIVDRDSFTFPVIIAREKGLSFKSGDEVAVHGKIVLVIPESREIELLVGNRSFTLKSWESEIDNRYFSYIKAGHHFKLGDAIILWGEQTGILRLKTDSQFKFRSGKSFTLEINNDGLLVSGRRKKFLVKNGETFTFLGKKWKFEKNRNGLLSYPCLGLKGWRRCYGFQYGAFSTILGVDGISHGIVWKFRKSLSSGKTRISLSIDDDLQKIASDVLEEEIHKIAFRERSRARVIETKIKILEKRLLSLRKKYKEAPSGFLVSKILSLEKQRESLYMQYKRLKNPFYEGAFLLMNQDGEILAAASYPYFPMRKTNILEGIRSGKTNYLINRCWEELYNPGSTFKLVDSIAFLESPNPWIKRLLRNFPLYGKNSINLKDKKLLSGQPIDFNLRNFREEEIKEKNCSLERALANSYNVYFAYLAMHSYPPLLQGVPLSMYPIRYFEENFSLLKYADSLGFNSSIDLVHWKNIHLLTAPSAFPVNAYKLNEVAHYSIGQADLKATPLQMAIIALSIYKKGRTLAPTLIKKIKIQEKVWASPVKQRKVFKEKTAKRIERAMNMVITMGTAKVAFGNWPYKKRTFAKTGTAETALYKDNSLFVGYLKKNREKALIFSLFIPRSGIGGRIAAPIARKFLASYLYYQRKKSYLKK